MSLSPFADLPHAHIRVVNLRHLRRLDWTTLILVSALAAIGIMTLVSANRSISWGTPFYEKQLIFLGLGTVLMLCIACTDYRFLVSLAPLMYAGALGLLVLVLFVGDVVKGGQRWLVLGPFRLQPSEVSKLALIMMLAWYFKTLGPQRIQRFHWFVLTFVIAAIPAGLILFQPNLGTTATLGPIVFAMLYVAGCKRWHLVGIVLAGIAAMPFAWFQLQEYQRQRVLSFLNPMADPAGSGYHTIQSMITVGSGGLTGKGYMQGTQTYLSYLPEHHSDFIFSLLAEEWGFMGGVTVLGLFTLLFLRGLWIARASEDVTGAVLVVGVVTILAFHMFVNVAITMGMLPVTGIPLPFLSSGGSFYLTTMMGIGLIMSVHARDGSMFGQ